MSDAPERVWAIGCWNRDAVGIPIDGFDWSEGSWDLRDDGIGDVEYVRADMLAQTLAANAALMVRLGALDAVVKAADALDDAANRFDLLSRDETVVTADDADATIEEMFAILRNSLAAYRKAKDTSHE